MVPDGLPPIYRLSEPPHGGPRGSDQSWHESSESAPAASVRSPWTPRNLIVLIGCGGLALVAANFLALTGYMLLARLTGWKAHPDQLQGNPFFLLSLQIVFHALVFGVIYLFLVVNHGLPFWETLKWRKPTGRMARRWFVGGIALAVFVQFAPSVLPDRDDFPLQRLFSSPEAGYAIAAFAIIIAPLMEELIFRGVLFNFFEHLIGVRFAVVSTALLFAGLHVPEYWGAWNHVMLIAIVGLVFSLARGLTGLLAPCLILHVGYNSSLMAALYFQTHGFQALAVR